MIRVMFLTSIIETITPHFAINIPKGAINIARIPNIINLASLGMRSNRRSKLSMSLLPTWCSAVPTQRKSIDFAIA